MLFVLLEFNDNGILFCSPTRAISGVKEFGFSYEGDGHDGCSCVRGDTFFVNNLVNFPFHFTIFSIYSWNMYYGEMAGSWGVRVCVEVRTNTLFFLFKGLNKIWLMVMKSVVRLFCQKL